MYNIYIYTHTHTHTHTHTKTYIQQVEVEELRQTLRDRSTDDNREKEDIIHLSERIAELESDRYSVYLLYWHKGTNADAEGAC